MADFKKHQQQFARHIRNPGSNPAPAGIEDRRLAIYRELFFNNIENFLSNTFPVLKSILGRDHWLEIARDFYSVHACETPLFAEIPQEFIVYLQTERKTQAADPVFMLELAHYEWIEMAIAISDADSNMPTVNPNGDLLNAHPVLSPVMQNLSYHYPVHRIGPDFQPLQADGEITHLVVFRNRQNEVRFLQINAITQQLIETLKQNPELTGLDVTRQIANQMAHPDPDIVVEAGKDLLYDLRRKDVIIGTLA